VALTKVRGAGAEGLTLSSTALTIANGLTLTDGDIAVASGHGISFAADGSASGMSSELLHDFEEGSFTPTLKNEGDTNLSPSYNSTFTHGRYVKIGTIVKFQFTVNLSGISGGSSSQMLIMNALPFTSKSYTTNSNGGANVTYQSTIGTDIKYGMVLGSSTSLRFYSATNTPSYSNMLQSTSWIQAYGQYETDS
jgi:hypothetical protein